MKRQAKGKLSRPLGFPLRARGVLAIGSAIMSSASWGAAQKRPRIVQPLVGTTGRCRVLPGALRSGPSRRCASRPQSFLARSRALYEVRGLDDQRSLVGLTIEVIGPAELWLDDVHFVP